MQKVHPGGAPNLNFHERIASKAAEEPKINQPCLMGIFVNRCCLYRIYLFTDL